MKSSGPNGRPALGGIAGLLLGIFLAVDLLLMGSIALDSPWVIIVPILGLVLGALLGWLGPLGFLRRSN